MARSDATIDFGALSLRATFSTRLSKGESPPGMPPCGRRTPARSGSVVLLAGEIGAAQGFGALDVPLVVDGRYRCGDGGERRSRVLTRSSCRTTVRLANDGAEVTAHKRLRAGKATLRPAPFRLTPPAMGGDSPGVAVTA
jgi:hypothetical protein